jgi:hypothetical protein
MYTDRQPTMGRDVESRPPEEITELLQAWSRGDQGAFDQLASIVYSELRRLARRYMAMERPDHTLQPTALVHEAYMRLANFGALDWKSRIHFFAISAQVMRRVLVDSHGRGSATGAAEPTPGAFPSRNATLWGYSMTRRYWLWIMP